MSCLIQRNREADQARLITHMKDSTVVNPGSYEVATSGRWLRLQRGPPAAL